MTLIMPILLFAICLGLFVPRMTTRWWFVLAGWILLVMLYNYVKPTAVPIPDQPVGYFRSVYDVHSRQT